MKRFEQCNKCPHRLTALMYEMCPLLVFTAMEEPPWSMDMWHVTRFSITCPGLKDQAAYLEIRYPEGDNIRCPDEL